MGGYLMDLYPMPKDKKPSGYGRACFAKDFFRRFAELGIQRLVDENGSLPKDFVVITVHKSSQILLGPLKKYGIKATSLPFPLYGGQEEFCRGLRKNLNIEL